MNPHSKGGHAAAGTQALGLPAAPPPPFPRRTIVADYCRTCGRTSGCWPGCAGGERVAAISHTRSVASARITSTENERTPLVAVLGGSGLNGVLEQLGAAHDPGR